MKNNSVMRYKQHFSPFPASLNLHINDACIKRDSYTRESVQSLNYYPANEVRAKRKRIEEKCHCGEINFACVIREDKVNLFFVLFLYVCVCVYIYFFFALFRLDTAIDLSSRL